jgi:Ca2+-binding EF-hand superfamily protein
MKSLIMFNCLPLCPFYDSVSLSIYSSHPTLLNYRNSFQNLNLREKDIQKFYKIFQQLDEDEDGYIQYHELLTLLNYETTKFSIHIFDIYDVNKVGKMNFVDFVFITWDFCTIEKTSLGKNFFSISSHFLTLLW